MKQTDNPLISVVIPSYNAEKYIKETILSVFKQTYRNFEIIVVDDSSTDRTPQIVKTLAENNERLRFFQIEHSGRPSVPLNYGIDNSQGKLIAFLDNDDIWTKHKLEEQLHVINSYKNLVFVYSMSVTFDQVSIFSPKYEILPLLFKAAHNREELITKGNSVTASTVLAKKEALLRAGKFDEDPELIAHDYDMWIRLGEVGDFKFIPRIHCYYRVHRKQLSGDWQKKKERLQYLAQKRNLKLPEYKFYRNKGILYLISRNILHYVTYLWVRLIGRLK